MSDPFFGGTTYKELGLLNPQQSGLLGSMIQNYASLGTRADNMQSAYQGAPQDYFNNAILTPMRNQYQDSLANMRNFGKRHSSALMNMTNKSNQQYTTGLGQLNAEFLNQERLRQMQAINDLRSQQANLYTIQNQLGGLALNRDTFENVAQQDSGILGKISSLLNMGGSLAGSIIGGAK